MAMAMRLAGDKEGKDKGRKGNYKGDEVVGDEKGEDVKAMVMSTRMVGKWTMTARKRAMAMATRVAGERQQWQQRGQWQWQR